MTANEPPDDRQWIARWLTSEAWWRDVASQALAGVLAVLVLGAGGAVVSYAVGLFGQPTGLRVIGATLVAIVGLVLAFGGSAVVGNALARRWKNSWFGYTIGAGLVGVVIFTTILSLAGWAFLALLGVLR
jgi:hypothetical protein